MIAEFNPPFEVGDIIINKHTPYVVLRNNEIKSIAKGDKIDKQDFYKGAEFNKIFELTMDVKGITFKSDKEKRKLL